MLPAMFDQHGANELKYIACNDLISLAIWMNSIGLHPFTVLIDMQQKERHMGQVKLPGQIRKHGREGFDVVGSVVRRERDTKQCDGDAGVPELLDHLFQVFSSGVYRNST